GRLSPIQFQRRSAEETQPVDRTGAYRAGDGGEELVEAFVTKQPMENIFYKVDSEIRWRVPWVDYFDPSTMSERYYSQLQGLLNRPEVLLVEKGAGRTEFNLTGLKNLNEPQRLAIENLSYDVVNCYVTLLLWKAYIYMRQGERD